MPNYNAARTHMVQSQLETNGVITRAIVEAFMSVPREYFVAGAEQAICYTDKEIDMGQGRFLLEPMVLAKMIEALAPEPSEQVLTIGGVSGYGAAVLAQIVTQVSDFEFDHSFDGLNQNAMDRLGYRNIIRIIGDLRQEKIGPTNYHAILIEGAMPEPPFELARLLHFGGRLVGIVVPAGGRMGQAVMLEKSMDGHVSMRPLFDAYAPYIPLYVPLPRFSFAS